MTRFLSESLEAIEPSFRLSLHHLEALHGHPSHDIRLSNEIHHGMRHKVQALGLDPDDSTPSEIYHALQQRVRADDKRLTRTLQTLAATHVSAEADVVAGMVYALKHLPDSKRCFALKPSSLKTLLKKQPPKKAMKRLGYRSFESFLKHETSISMLTAAVLCEDDRWQQKFHEQYKRLKPSDFEERNLQVIKAEYKRWHDLSDSVVMAKKHTVLSLKELGAVVLLPMPAHMPAGVVTASLSLALHELNEIRSGTSFLRLSQTRADFGAVVQAIIGNEPVLRSQLLDRPVAWRLIQAYYSRLQHLFDETLFEPHLQLEDMVWYPVEQSLAAIEPALKFWEHTAHLGVLHHRRAVSCNIVDAALNCCNNLPFERRVVHYFQQALRHELSLRYLKHEAVEAAVFSELQPQLATELAIT